MKRILSIMAMLLAFSFGVSGQNSNKQETKKMKTLVTYFSCTGTTENVAKQLAETVKGDLYRIQPEKPYTPADLDWTDKQSRSTLEMKDKSSRPAIANKVENMHEYDIVFVGFPIWWYTAPTIINTFMESYDFTGKTVIPFATSGGTGMRKTNADLKKAYPKVNWKEGKLLNDATKSSLSAWTKGIE